MADWLVWASGGLTLVSLYLAGRKSALTWPVGLAAQVVWVLWALHIHSIGLLVFELVYAGVVVRNLVLWGGTMKNPFRRTPPIIVTPTISYVDTAGPTISYADDWAEQARKTYAQLMRYVSVCTGCGCLVDRNHVKTVKQVILGPSDHDATQSSGSRSYCLACVPEYSVEVVTPDGETRYYASAVEVNEEGDIVEPRP